jgi:hypothetical protein
MKRREFLAAAAGAAVVAGVARSGWGQEPAAPPPDPGRPASADPAKLARISIMTLNFGSILKLPGQNASPARTLDVFDLPQMYADVYGVHNIEFQHSHIVSTEPAYLKELRARVERVKSRITQINMEFGSMNISAADPVQRVQAIDLTKRWVDHAVILGCPRVMANQGQPSQENKAYTIATLKAMGDYAKSKGVKVSMETRGGGGGGRRGGAAGTAAAPSIAGGPPPGGIASPPAPPTPPPAPAAPTGPPAYVLLKEIIEGSGTYSNVDIGGVGAPNQQALHTAILALLPSSSGNMHIKRSPNWDLPTAIKYTVEIGYKGLYSIELNGHDATRDAYNVILANI